MFSKDRNNQAATTFFDSHICVENMIWLAGESAKQSDAFKDFIEMSPETCDELLGFDPEQFDYEMEDIVCHLARTKTNGFLVQFSWPCPDQFHADGGFTFSCVRNLRWIYSEDLEGIEDKAVQLCEASQAERKQELENASS